MPLAIQNLHTFDDSGPYIVEINVDIQLRTAVKSTSDDPLLVRANIYRPKTLGKFPVLVTYGPCKLVNITTKRMPLKKSEDGKDVPYEK